MKNIQWPAVKRRLKPFTPGIWPGIIEFALVAGLLVVLGLARGHSQELATTNPNKVKAAFIRNFAHYITWPSNSFSSGTEPWHVGVLGSNPFGDLLEKTFAGRTEQGRSFQVSRAETLAALLPCHILFIAEQDPVKRRAVLAKLHGKPVLTVGDAPDFLQEGGVIRFSVADHVEMSINIDEAHLDGLEIPSQLFEVSAEVLENGKIRKLR